MWIKVILLASLAILGKTFVLDDLNEIPKSLDELLEELRDRELSRRGNSLQEECEGKPADIAFIVDDSRSIYPPDFYTGMNFLKSFVNIFDVGPNNVRIATVTFGEVVITDSAFGFDAHQTKGEVLQALSDFKFREELGGGTATAKAISYARKQFFAKARPNVVKIGIVLTDGLSGNPRKTAAEAQLLKRQGVKLIAIGVSRSVDEAELKAIASDADSVFKVDSYGALKNIILKLGFVTCRITTTAAPTTVPTTIPTTIPTTVPTTTPPPKAEPCNGQAIDFNFVFDPAQMGTSGTEGTIRFIKTVASAEDLNNGKIRVGTVTGPCPDTKGFRLNRYSSLPEILTHFDAYKTTEMSSLITDLRSEAFAPQNGGRTDARKVGVVFLKGKLSDPERAVLEAELAKTRGIEIFIVDMGSLNHESVLEAMASGKTTHILRASDSSEIVEMGRTLVSEICKKKKEPTC